MNEAAVVRCAVGLLQGLLWVVVAEPLLPVVRALLVEGEANCLVRVVVPDVLDLVEVLEPLARLRGRGCAQSLVVFQVPALFGGGAAIGPTIRSSRQPSPILRLTIEGDNHLPL